MSILIAGCGYLGTQIALSSENRKLGYTALSLSGKVSAQLSGEILRCDLSDLDAVKKISHTIAPPSHIIQCASSNHGGPDAYRSIYLQGARNLLACFPTSPLFFTSSTSVYAQTDGSLIDENSPAEPTQETSQILRQTEDVVLAHSGTVLRLSGIYGPHRCLYLKRLLQHNATIHPDSAHRYLNQIHRDDAATAILHLLALPQAQVAQQIFNISDDNNWTQQQCYQQLAHKLKLPAPPLSNTNQARKRAKTHRRISNQKLTQLGWSPAYPTLLDALDHDPHLLPSFAE
ncbi:MAG: NAD-dependent epimerase/dehydratase family protein [Verrucomicrobiales bacterium]|nr:NAD-dependent epimerase/dehydratase family protein [Verrucomicrobiales bacterium]